ncbi:MAG: two-component regulator propeller domain-containing protein [Ferruginibacter sp.]
MIKINYPASFLLLFAMQLMLNAFAQTSYHVTTGQGLATNQLTILIKDRQNNMWFGSYNGLHKHEGTSIRVYNKSGKDSTSLSSKEMHAVFEDRLGFIWAGTTGGLDKLDPKTGIILHYKLKPANKTKLMTG